MGNERGRGIHVSRLSSFAAIALTTLPACADRATSPVEVGLPTAAVADGGTGLIAFESRLEGNLDIWVMNPDGTAFTNLTRNPATDESPDWSGNGRQIVFLSMREGNSEVYTMNADGTAPTRLTDTPDAEVSPDFSPNGRRIAFHRPVGTAPPDVFVINADGTQETNLTADPSADVQPAWSPDGKQIAFVSNRSGSPELYVMGADGSNVVRLTPLTDAFGASLPTWSPNGKQIALADDFTVLLINSDGTSLTPIATFTDFIHGLDWSPNGKQLILSKGGAISRDLYRINADGTGLVQLTFNGALNGNPSWGK